MGISRRRLLGLYRLLPIFLIAFSLFSAVFVITAPAQKAYATDPDRICIPPYDDSTKVPSGWLGIRFVNRATIEVTYTPNGNCISPAGQSSEFIFGNVRFSDLVNGNLVDRNVGDGNYEYVFVEDSGSNSEESRIDQFHGGLDGATGDAFGGQDKILSPADIRNNIASIEYIMGFEEDLVTADCEDNQNLNWALYDVNSDGEGMKWECVSNISGSVGGFRVGSLVQNIENFNITYRVSGEGEATVIEHVSPDEQDTRTFTWCGSQFRNDNCSGDLYINATIEQIAAIGGGTGDLEIRRDGDEETVRVTVAGAENPNGDTPGDTTGQIGGEEEDNTCENITGVLGWIFCPIIRVLDTALSWMDTRIQAMLSIDENKYTSPELFRAWAQIRNIAYIILIPIMLVMVIGTAIGVEAFSAYTVKRALPRMVAAVIFITFSWYICGFLINFFNVVGGGTLGLLTSPFSEIRGSLSTLSLADLFGPNENFISTFLADAAIAAGVAVLLWLFLGSIVLVVLTAFLVLLLRQMFIVAMILMAPLAILAWIFPGNDKLWKLWWNAFTKLLMMFPIIMGIIAIGRIFAVIILETSSGFSDAILTPLMAVAAYVLPYAFIPFTFKLAGGFFGTLTGMVNDRQKGLFDRQKEKRAHKTERAGRRVLQKRANMARSLETLGSKKNATWAGRLAAGRLAKGIGGYNMEAAMSARNAQVAKELNDQIATGKDDDIRGLTAAASQDYAKKNGFDAAAAQGMARVHEGRRQYKSLGGAWVDEANVNAGRKRWGNDRFAQQAALSYEMRKAMDDDQVEGVRKNYAAVASSWGMTDSEAGGAWIGAAFENQNQHLEFKSTDWKSGTLKGDSFVNEVFEKKGSYPLSQMSGHTVGQLAEAYRGYETRETELQGKGTLNQAEQDELATIQSQKAKVKEIANTFVQRGGVQGMAGPEESAEPITGRASGDVSAPGSGNVNQKVRELAELTGVGPYAPGAPRPAGPQGPQTPPAPGTYRDNDGNTRQSGGPGGGGVILGG